MQDLTVDVINKLHDLMRPEVLEIGGKTYTTEKIFPVLEAMPAVLTINTLTGLADYLTQNPDKNALGAIVVHVESHDKVNVLSAIDGDFAQRACFLSSVAKIDLFPFARPMDLETFIINLQAKFVQDDTTAALLKIVGNLSSEAVVNFSDDGTTQKVQARTGIARVAEVAVPNPVTLAPYRTFLEVAQPESKFVYRLKQDGTNISCALHEADGGNWKLEAIKRIRDWLRLNIPEEVVILA